MSFGGAESQALPVGVAMGNSAVKPIKRRGNEKKLNLGGSCRVCTINYVILSNIKIQEICVYLPAVLCHFPVSVSPIKYVF